MRERLMVLVSRLILQIGVFVVLIFGSAATAQAGNSGDAVSAIRPAVVFINLPAGREGQTGSGVVVHTDSHGSDILTAAHVVRPGGPIFVYMQGNLNEAFPARIVRISKGFDLALIHTKQEAPTEASIASSATNGEAIAVLGYPSNTSVSRARTSANMTIVPESRVGTITSFPSNGFVISTTARTEAGDSGAPIFTQDNSEVVGIVTAHYSSSKYLGFQGHGAKAIRKFLTAAHVAFSGPYGEQGTDPIVEGVGERTGQLLKDSPGAHKFLVDAVLNIQFGLAPGSPNTVVPNATQASLIAYTSTLRRRIDSTLGATFGSSFSDDTFLIQNMVSPAELGKAARERRNVAAVQELFTVSTGQSGFGLVNQLTLKTTINVVDQYGDIVFVGESSKTKHQVLPFTEAQVEGAWDDATQESVAQIAASATADGSDAGLNFGRFGIPLATGHQSAFLTVTPDQNGVRVATLFPYGSAARSSLQVGDLIVSLDGQDLKETPLSQRAALFDNHASDYYRCGVLQPDGRAVPVNFKKYDVGWYLANPEVGVR